MRCAHNIRMGILAAFAHPMRLGLTIMSVTLGVIALMCFTSLAERSIYGTGQWRWWTARHRSEAILVIPSQGPDGKKLVSIDEARRIAKAIRTNSRNIPATALGTAVYRRYTVDIGGDKQKRSVSVTTKMGWDGSQPALRECSVAAGRDFTDEEAGNGALVCLISRDWPLRLTGSSDAVGKTLSLNGRKFKIIGTYGTDGKRVRAYGMGLEFMGGTGQVVVPFNAAKRVLEPTNSGVTTMVRAYYADPEQAYAGGRRLAGQASRVRPDPGYRVASVEEEYRMHQLETKVARMILGIVGGLTLSIALMSLLNMTLVALSERIREIGLRRALGARRGEIVLQFAVEASMVAIVAWGTGIGLAALMLAKMTSMLGLILPFSGYWVQASLTTTLGLSLLVSVVPAWLATRVTPAVALRYE